MLGEPVLGVAVLGVAVLGAGVIVGLLVGAPVTHGTSSTGLQTVSLVAVAAAETCCKPGKQEVMGMHTVSLVDVADETWYCKLEHTITSSQTRRDPAVIAVSQRVGRSV